MSALKALSEKKDFEVLKKRGKKFSHAWMSFIFSSHKEKTLKLAWILSKKNISSAVLRNRLKRWGRDNLRKQALKGLILISCYKKEPGFYKSLRREEFDNVFFKILKKINQD